MKKLTWYNELGFFSNPFSIKPAAFHNELFGNDSAISKITEKMSEPGMIFISGEFGTGKTTVLKKLIAEFRGSNLEGKKIIYYNCNQSGKSINYNELLINSGGFLRRLFSIRKKNMIIFLDEIQDMNRKDMEQIKKYYDNKFFKLVVFVSKYEDTNLTPELKDVISENKFKLGNMTENQAVEMIRERIGGLKFVTDEIIIQIFNKDKNSRSFLKNCEDVCRYAFEKENSVVTKEHVVEVLE
jgi:Cdc6-like AAA superfamily ATPase